MEDDLVAVWVEKYGLGRPRALLGRSLELHALGPEGLIVRLKIVRVEDELRLVEAMATGPAATFGLVNKGAIEVGRDADLMVVNPGEVQEIRGEDLHSKCSWTAFEGWEATFPHTVFLRGDPIILKGELEGPLMGRFVSPGA